jgi:hypothetical protein
MGNCGQQPTHEEAHRVGSCVVACAIVLLLALLGLGFCASARAAGGAPRPNPEKLWRSYPLDTAHTSSSSSPGAGAQRPKPARTSPGPAVSSTSEGRSDSSWGVWLGAAAALLAAGVGAIVLTARSRPTAPDAPERSVEAPEPTPEETLKRKVEARGPDLDAKLKAKAREATVRKDLLPRDVVVLKAKLAAPAAKPEPRRRRERPDDGRAGKAIRSANAGERRANGKDGKAKPAERSRIEWWRGYVKSEFYARVPSPDGGSVVVRSRSFNWIKPTPPPQDVPRIAQAHEALVSRLEADGWRPTGCGDEWYELELGRDPETSLSEVKGGSWTTTWRTTRSG